MGEGNGCCPGDREAHGGDSLRCGSLRRPWLEEVIDDQVGFDFVKDEGEGRGGHSEGLAEGEDLVAGEIFGGVPGGREVVGGEVDWDGVDLREERRVGRGLERSENRRGGREMDDEVAVVELFCQLEVGDDMAMS